MARIVQQTIALHISKLVRDSDDTPALSDEQLAAILETLPGVVDQILDDTSAVVEIELED